LSNPHAVYLFMEAGKGYKGKRLYMTMVKEEKNAEQIVSLQRRKSETQVKGDRFLVFFELVQERPLVGDDSKS